MFLETESQSNIMLTLVNNYVYYICFAIVSALLVAIITLSQPNLITMLKLIKHIVIMLMYNLSFNATYLLYTVSCFYTLSLNVWSAFLSVCRYFIQILGPEIRLTRGFVLDSIILFYFLLLWAFIPFLCIFGGIIFSVIWDFPVFNCY